MAVQLVSSRPLTLDTVHVISVSDDVKNNNNRNNNKYTDYNDDRSNGPAIIRTDNYYNANYSNDNDNKVGANGRVGDNGQIVSNGRIGRDGSNGRTTSANGRFSSNGRVSLVTTPESDVMEMTTIDVTSSASLHRLKRVRTISDNCWSLSGDRDAKLVFKDVTVVIDNKTILDQVSGVARPGEMLAIMGPSGAGKSTLLNSLTGRVPVTSGLVTLDGQVVGEHMRRKISYVLQQDVFYPNLTLRETLTYAAMLRLPERMPHKLKLERISQIVDILELNKCLDTKIGSTFVTGLSGGEKKRASIACELLNNPRIIILDEPTSGLDSAIAYSLMATLSKYATQSNKTVVTTIHQPAAQIFSMFTNVLLITDGHTAYFGPGSKALDFFGSLGLHCEPHYNPADFILEQSKAGPETMPKILAAARALRQAPDWPLELSEMSHMGGASEGVVIGVNNKQQNPPKHRPKQQQQEHVNTTRGKQAGGHLSSHDTPEVGQFSSSGYDDDSEKYPTSFLSQYSTLTRRTFRRNRHRYLSKYTIGQMMFMSVAVGLVWFQTARTEEAAKDRFGILFFILVQNSFHPMMEAIFAISDPTGVFTRERSADIYRLSAYYLATMTSEIPTTFCVLTMYIFVAYWMTGLMKAASNFFALWFLLELNVFTAQSLGFLLGLLIQDKQFAVIIGQCVTVLSMLAGGFYNTHVQPWFQWVRYISYVTYGLTAAATIEFSNGDPFLCAPANQTTHPKYCLLNTTTGQESSDTSFSPVSALRYIPGSEFLASWGLYEIPIYATVLILVIALLILRIIGYLVLRFKPHKPD